MREIKFRAWHIKYKYMSEVEMFNEFYVFTKMNEKLLFDNCKIMQYTGLKDKNGNEIYEGDICLVDKQYSLIQYDNYEASYKLIHQDIFPKNHLNQFLASELIVVGNIYENPELLEGDE